MSGFSEDWLALREPMDTLARDAALPALLVKHFDRTKPLSLVDLGSGTGANLRFVAPLLGGEQDWLLVDNDPQLLRVAQKTLMTWAQGIGAVLLEQGETLQIEHADFQCRVRIQVLDLANNMAGLELVGVHCVTASAFLDLVSGAWLEDLALRCCTAGAAVYFALTYDGRIRWQPRDSFDAHVRHLVNCHQLTDKGFGPALGPHATAACNRIFGGYGYQLKMSRSNWQIEPSNDALQSALLTGWARAAQEIDPEQTAAFADWQYNHWQHIIAGRSQLMVGHRDLIGWS